MSVTEDLALVEILLVAGPGKAPPCEMAITEQGADGFCGRVGNTAAPGPSAWLP